MKINLMINKLLVTLTLLLILGGCSFNYTPVQEELMMAMNPPVEDVWISSEELIEILPAFSFVHPGVYKLVPRGLVSKLHEAPWCAPGAWEMHKPYQYDCQDYSYDVLEAFDELGDSYAVGVAWYDNDDKTDGHMVFVFIDTEQTVILYEPQDCQFIRMPVNGLCIGVDCLNYKRGVGRDE